MCFASSYRLLVAMSSDVVGRKKRVDLGSEIQELLSRILCERTIGTCVNGSEAGTNFIEPDHVH
jgi:hypothetical protein